MLQIDHIYEFFYQEIFKKFVVISPPGSVLPENFVGIAGISVYIKKNISEKQNDRTYDHDCIFFYDQEPMDVDKLLPYINDGISYGPIQLTLAVSEKSQDVAIWQQRQISILYYFFHGFAALDWYRGYYALNYKKSAVRVYRKDFISFNRIISNDRSYRIYFVSKLTELGLLKHGLVSFGVSNNTSNSWKDEILDVESKLSNVAKLHIEENLLDTKTLIIDQFEIFGSASADIPRTINGVGCPDYDAFWHIVTETVFYYDKLHLTEKIFKPIVSKQPFMLLAAPGNLAYLKSYGFKTFEGIIDESYDGIQDNDARIDAVVKQIKWYCNLSQEEKSRVIEAIAPIVEYNFQHFYGKFKEIITDELLNNTKTLFKELEYDDSDVNYATVRKLLTS